jgi:hypothetical protein
MMPTRSFVCSSFLLVLATGAASQAALATGGSSTNGGGLARYRFETAKDEAAAIVAGLTPEALSSDAEPRVLDFLTRHAPELAVDILASTADWAAPPTQPTCAATTRLPHAPIFLSEDLCRDVSLVEAIQLLIHESVHHLGVDDEGLAYAVSAAAFTGRRNAAATPLCAALAGHWRVVGEPEGRVPLAREISVDALDCSRVVVSGWGVADVVFKEARETTQRLTKDDEVLTTFTQAFPAEEALVVSWRASIGMPAPRPADVRAGTLVLVLHSDGRLRVRGAASFSSTKDVVFAAIGTAAGQREFSATYERQ